MSKFYGAWSLRYNRWLPDAQGRTVCHPHKRLVKADLQGVIDGGINQYEVRAIGVDGLPALSHVEKLEGQITFLRHELDALARTNPDPRNLLLENHQLKARVAELEAQTSAVTP